jgi:hypothetical protein
LKVLYPKKKHLQCRRKHTTFRTRRKFEIKNLKCRFPFLSAVNMKTTQFWAVILRSVVVIYRLLEKLPSSLLECGSSGVEWIVCAFFQTTWHSIQEDSYLSW